MIWKVAHILFILLVIFFVSISSIEDCSPKLLRLNDVQNGRWILAEDGTFKLYFSHCKLRFPTSSQAKSCLANNHLVFMGDSLTRYLYVSLASFITTGKWGQKLSYQTSKKNPSSIMWEKDFPLWSEYYRVSNSLLNDYGSSTYEICDCFRDDTKTWDAIQRDCVENRHFRSYIKREKGSEGGDSMLRLSYIQFYGPMPMRGRRILSTDLPDSEGDYLKYIEMLGDKICPESMRYSTNTTVGEGEVHHYPRTGYIDITSSMVPMTAPCGSYLRDARDKPFTKLMFPQFWDDDGDKFEKQVLEKMGVTHLILNIGWHAPLDNHEEAVKATTWLQARIHNAKKYFKSTEAEGVHTEEVVGKHHHLALPQVTWRGSTSPAPFGEYNDKVARNLHEKLIQEATNDVSDITGINDVSGGHGDRLGYMHLWDLTQALQQIDYWIVKYEGKIDYDLISKYLKARELQTTPSNVSDKKLADLLKLQFDISPEMLSYLEELNERGKSEVVLPRVYVDHAHMQPWVYNELNNVFLNNICHLH